MRGEGERGKEQKRGGGQKDLSSSGSQGLRLLNRSTYVAVSKAQSSLGFCYAYSLVTQVCRSLVLDFVTS